MQIWQRACAFLVHQHVVAGEQAVIAVLVSDDLNRGINFVVAFSMSPPDGGGQARGRRPPAVSRATRRTDMNVTFRLVRYIPRARSASPRSSDGAA